MNAAEQELKDFVQQIHLACFKLCKLSTGCYLPVAGNIAIFCQSDADYDRLSTVAASLTQPSDDPNQKYFLLKEPILIPAMGGTPSATYAWLYIRKPAYDSPELGDVDFVLELNEYLQFKQQVIAGKVPYAQVYARPGWDMVELRNPDVQALPYISTVEMAEKVHVRF